jgi:transcriptional antiterminator NusG
MIQEPTTPETDQEAAERPDAPEPPETGSPEAEAAAQTAAPPAAEETEASGDAEEAATPEASEESDAEEAATPTRPEEGAESPGADADEAAAEATEEPAESEVDDDPDKKWYVIHTYSGYESKVKAAIEERLQASPLTELFGAILVPTEDVVEMRGGRRRVSSRKYYPGYILIQMTMNTDTWYLVKNTPKVKFEEGENLRVVDGPFVNFSGVVEAVNHERGKVRIMVTIFGRPTPVELEFLQVEKI